MVDLSKIRTEYVNERSYNIDRVNTEEALRIINEEDKEVPIAIGRRIEEIAKVIDELYERLKGYKDARLIYVGAGTSGRIGVLDAAELGPTFNFDRAVGLIAGSEDGAFFNPDESREDNKEAGVEDMKRIDLSARDCVIGIMASGRTPYTIGALEEGRRIGALTVAITCNPEVEFDFDHHVAIGVGPEVISGSTRMKAGTAQKLVLNMISTTLMIKMGKTYHNLMVDVMPGNEKLVERAIGIIQKAAGLENAIAGEYFTKSGGSAKTAIVMAKKGLDKEEAERILEENDGVLNKILED